MIFFPVMVLSGQKHESPHLLERTLNLSLLCFDREETDKTNIQRLLPVAELSIYGCLSICVCGLSESQGVMCVVNPLVGGISECSVGSFALPCLLQITAV